MYARIKSVRYTSFMGTRAISVSSAQTAVTMTRKTATTQTKKGNNMKTKEITQITLDMAVVCKSSGAVGWITHIDKNSVHVQMIWGYENSYQFDKFSNRFMHVLED